MLPTTLFLRNKKSLYPYRLDITSTSRPHLPSTRARPKKFKLLKNTKKWEKKKFQNQLTKLSTILKNTYYKHRIFIINE